MTLEKTSDSHHQVSCYQRPIPIAIECLFTCVDFFDCVVNCELACEFLVNRKV